MTYMILGPSIFVLQLDFILYLQKFNSFVKLEVEIIVDGRWRPLMHVNTYIFFCLLMVTQILIIE